MVTGRRIETMSKRTKLLSIALAALLLAAVPAAALAQEVEDVPSWPLVRGRVEALLDSGFVLSAPQRELTVSVDAETVYRVPGIEDAGLADLQVGDAVLSLGRRDGEGGFLARMVEVLPPMPFGTVKGQITAIEGQTITLTTAAGEKVLHIDGNTQFRVPDVEAPTLGEVKEGDRVFAILYAEEDGTLLAKTVAVIPEGAFGPVGFRGRVLGVSVDTLRVSVRKDEVSVEITDTTKLRVPGVEDPSLADIHKGDWVLVIARLKGLCRVEATAVAVIPPVPAHRYVIPGEVIDIDGTTLIVQDPNDQHLVLTDQRTQVRIKGLEEATVTDIEVGDQVLALGQPAARHSLLARLILVRRPDAPEAGQLNIGESVSSAPRF
jgi:hypothetical protein